jgi:tetratricopeptide (TPR) repeat protein
LIGQESVQDARNQVNKKYKFKAYISYNHHDESWASWLHKALESFRVPKRLVGSQGEFGALPAKLAPVFRDREDLSSGDDLNEQIHVALRDSETLIVVCSPDSARSRWVNEEISYFRSLGRGNRIYSVIVKGDPQARSPGDRCFAPALLQDENGRAHEPMAADARKWGDGRELACLKLVSSVLGISLDDLRRRALQAKRKKNGLLALAAVIFVSLAMTAFFSKMAERDSVKHAEILVAKMVEASKGLDEVADLETLKTISDTLAGYLETFAPEDLSDASSMQVSHVMSRLGQVARLQGHPAEAMEAFTRSHDILKGLVARAPKDLKAMFELGQVEFWIGYLFSDSGDWNQATVSFTKYFDISQRLHLKDPDNAEWAMEMAYALSNLGMIEQRRIPVDRHKAIDYMVSAMEFNQRAVELDPAEDYYQEELADSHANLADAWLEICDLDSALSARQENVSYANDFYSKNKSNQKLKENYSYSLSGLGWVQRQVGNNDQALLSFTSSFQLLSELSEQDPSNLKYQWNLYRTAAQLAAQLALTGRSDEAWRISADTVRGFRRLIKEDDSISVVNGIAYARFLTNYSDLAWRRGDNILAKRWLDEGIDRFRQILAGNPDSSEALIQLRAANFVHWQQNNQQLTAEMKAILDAIEYPDPLDLSCVQASLAVHTSIMKGDSKLADTYISYLQGKAYNDPEFVRFCTKQDLCRPLDN